jgi:hypothetical protein
MMNLYTDNMTVFESMMSKINPSEIQEMFLNSVSSFESSNHILTYKQFIVELASKFVDEQREQLRSLIETSKLLKNYVKDTI